MVSDKNNPQIINAVEKIKEIVNTNSFAASSTVKKKTKEGTKIKLEAYRYATALVDMTAKMSNADDILKIANRIKDEILSEYNTPEIALRYARVLGNATVEMSNADDILEIANRIKDEILSEYNTYEIALRYAMALVNATAKMSNADDILNISDRIKDILIKYNTKEIAEVYVVALKFICDNHPNHEYLLKEIDTVRHEYDLLFDNKWPKLHKGNEK